MDLRRLLALVAVSEHGSFSAAADALHTVQSNISAHIGRLERELGTQLVDRAGCRLTEEGEIVVARARRALAEIEAIVTDLAALRDDVRGSVRVGIISSTARWLTPLLLRAVHERHPNVSVVVVDATTSSLVPQVVRGVLDAAVINMPVTEPELAVEPLFDERFVLVTPDGHPLGGRRRLDVGDLAGVALLLPPRGTAFRAELDAAAARAGVALEALAELDGVRLIASLVLQGYGPAILPASTISSWRPGGWHAVPLTGIPPRRVAVARRRRALPSAPTRALLEVLREVVTANAAGQPGITPAVDSAGGDARA
jgi:LysR family hydrogen peroxide-inducible transcriptional activator